MKNDQQHHITVGNVNSYYELKIYKILQKMTRIYTGFNTTDAI